MLLFIFRRNILATVLFPTPNDPLMMIIVYRLISL